LFQNQVGEIKNPPASVKHENILVPLPQVGCKTTIGFLKKRIDNSYMGLNGKRTST